MGLFSDWRKRRKPDESNQGFEYYEDTHDEYGDYVGPSFAPKTPKFQTNPDRSTYQNPDRGYQNPDRSAYQNPDRGYQNPDRSAYQNPDRGYQNPDRSAYQNSDRSAYQNPDRGYQSSDRSTYQNPDRSAYQNPERGYQNSELGGNQAGAERAAFQGMERGMYQGQSSSERGTNASYEGGGSSAMFNNNSRKEGENLVKMPDSSQHIQPRNYQNVVVYKPSSPEDVQTLIDFLKRREPAIVNLDDVDGQFSQRILDFISGAIYALSGSVHRIAGNIFLLSPEGVEITVPYEHKREGN